MKLVEWPASSSSRVVTGDDHLTYQAPYGRTPSLCVDAVSGSEPCWFGRIRPAAWKFCQVGTAGYAGVPSSFGPVYLPRRSRCATNLLRGVACQVTRGTSPMISPQLAYFLPSS